MQTTWIQIGGSIMSAMITAVSLSLNAFNIRPGIELKWVALISFICFVGFVWWGWHHSEKRARGYEYAAPHIEFTQSCETPLFIEQRKPIYHGLQLWFSNRPKVSAESSVARDITARVTFYNRESKAKLDIAGVFVSSVAPDFAGYKNIGNKLDSLAPNDEQCKLQIALKWQDDESAYAFALESFLYSPTQDGREATRELNLGSHYVRVSIRGTRVNEHPLWFILTNPGKGKDLSISQQIQRPNLRKEGFQTE